MTFRRSSTFDIYEETYVEYPTFKLSYFLLADSSQRFLTTNLSYAYQISSNKLSIMKPRTHARRQTLRRVIPRVFRKTPENYSEFSQHRKSFFYEIDKNTNTTDKLSKQAGSNDTAVSTDLWQMRHATVPSAHGSPRSGHGHAYEPRGNIECYTGKSSFALRCIWCGVSWCFSWEAERLNVTISGGLMSPPASNRDSRKLWWYQRPVNHYQLQPRVDPFFLFFCIPVILYEFRFILIYISYCYYYFLVLKSRSMNIMIVLSCMMYVYVWIKLFKWKLLERARISD